MGTFDGVHLGHRQVFAAAVAAGLSPTIVTFDPHPRITFGYEVELLTSLERRLELIAEAGIADTLVVDFDLEFAQLEPEAFVEAFLRPLGTEVIVAGADFRFGHRRTGDLALLGRLGFDVRTVPLVEGVSSSRIRDLLRAGEIERAARLLGRAPEVEGLVVAGDARGGTLGFPTANLRVDPDLLVPAHGIYAGAAGGHRAAISIGTNPHYGGEERRVEAFLLDFSGDLYGRKLVVELWQRLREEAAFASEEELVAQIARDVEQTRAARPPLEAAQPEKGAETGR
jgi:riboflavin kinase/FMN adenylyltransferase